MPWDFKSVLRTAHGKVARLVLKPLRTGPSHVSRLGTEGSTSIEALALASAPAGHFRALTVG